MGGPKLARGDRFGFQNWSGGTGFSGGPMFSLQTTERHNGVVCCPILAIPLYIFSDWGMVRGYCCHLSDLMGTQLSQQAAF